MNWSVNTALNTPGARLTNVFMRKFERNIKRPLKKWEKWTTNAVLTLFLIIFLSNLRISKWVLPTTHFVLILSSLCNKKLSVVNENTPARLYKTATQTLCCRSKKFKRRTNNISTQDWSENKRLYSYAHRLFATNPLQKWHWSPLLQYGLNQSSACSCQLWWKTEGLWVKSFDFFYELKQTAPWDGTDRPEPRALQGLDLLDTMLQRIESWPGYVNKATLCTQSPRRDVNEFGLHKCNNVVSLAL